MFVKSCKFNVFLFQIPISGWCRGSADGAEDRPEDDLPNSVKEDDLRRSREDDLQRRQEEDDLQHRQEKDDLHVAAAALSPTRLALLLRGGRGRGGGERVRVYTFWPEF